jgi:hypothetical protein
MLQPFALGIHQKERRNVQIKYLMQWYNFQHKNHMDSLHTEPGLPQGKTLPFIYGTYNLPSQS